MAQTTKQQTAATAEVQQSVFHRLYSKDVSQYVEKKGKLKFCSWARIWAMLKDEFPDAIFEIYENPQGWPYFTDGKTCWVKTGIIVGDIEHIEYLPVMNSSHRSIPLERVTSYDVNTAIQRSLTKAAARHGLGLSVYEGEDIPDEEPSQEPQPQQQPAAPQNPRLQDAIFLIGQTANVSDIQRIASQYPDLCNDKDFKKAMNDHALYLQRVMRQQQQFTGYQQQPMYNQQQQA